MASEAEQWRGPTSAVLFELARELTPMEMCYCQHMTLFRWRSRKMNCNSHYDKAHREGTFPESSPFQSQSNQETSKMSAPTDPVQLVPGNSLITKTPEEGRQLAIKLSRLIIKVTQPDAAVREKLRAVYAQDAAMLIAIGQTVAMEFATIAAANNYWK